MFERGYILGRKGRFRNQLTLHIITKRGWILGWRGRFNYDTQFAWDELLDLYPMLHTRRLDLDSLL